MCLEGGQPLSSHSSIHYAMITAKCSSHHNGLLVWTFFVVTGNDAIFQSTNGKSTRLWFSNNRSARFDAVHAQIQNCESSQAAQNRRSFFTFFHGFQSICKCFQVGSNRFQTLSTSIGNDGRVQGVARSNNHIQIHFIVYSHVRVHP